MKRKIFTVLGGDKRSIALADLLKNNKNDVRVYGFDNLNSNLNKWNDLSEAIKSSDIIIGPLPISKDSVTLNASFTSNKIYLEEILSLLNSNQLFIAGKIDEETIEKAKSKGIQIEDYFSREEMQILNAIPTAEGAIQTAMEEMKVTLNNSNTMILGYGRIGKTLAKMLQGIGANVYVEARKFEDLAWIKSYEYIPVNIKDLNLYIDKMNVIFNTIPSLILNEKLLNNLKKDCIVIELASLPGGIDLKAAENLNIKIIKAGGLPGKVAPITAANIIMDTVFNIITEKEEEK